MLDQLSKTYKFEAVISKQKHSVARIYDSHEKCKKKLKVICIANTSQEYIKSLSHAIKDIAEIYRKRSQQFYQIKQLVYTKDGKQLFIIESNYLDCDSLARTLQKQKNLDTTKNSQKTILYNTFQLLDCFLQILELNAFIPTINNIYVQSGRFTFNFSSFCGFDLIIFEKPIKKSEFKQIYTCLDPKIFKRNTKNRLNHEFKIYCFASLLLVVIFQRPIRLLKDSQLQQIITVQRAKELISDLPMRYAKFLNIKQVKQVLSKYSQYYSTNLFDFFFEILVENHIVQQESKENKEIKETKTWCTLFQQLKPNHQNQENNDEQDFIDKMAEKMWRNFDENQKKWLINCKIVDVYYNNQERTILIRDNNKQLLLVYLMGLKFTEIDQYSLQSELKKKNQRYDKISEKLIYQLLKIWKNFTKINNKQSALQSIQLQEENFFINEVLHQIEIYSDPSDLTESTLTSTNYSTSDDQNISQEQKLTQNRTKCAVIFQGEAQANQKKIRTNDEIIYDIRELIKSKLASTIQIQNKLIPVQHQILKSLNTFQRSLR